MCVWLCVCVCVCARLGACVLSTARKHERPWHKTLVQTVMAAMLPRVNETLFQLCSMLTHQWQQSRETNHGRELPI